MSALVERAVRRARQEDGLTVVEVVVAGLILTVASLGVLGMVDAATRNTFRVEQAQLLNNVLQREMEEIRATPYDDLGLGSLPAHQSGENNPNSRVVGTSFYTNRNGTALKSMVAGGTLLAGPEPFAIEDVTGSIYRYVVWDNCPGTTCVDGELLKRVILVAKLNDTASGGSNRRYQEFQAEIVDPDAAPTEKPGPAPGGAPVTRWLLWLTDTPCSSSGRIEIEGNHLAHNTRGECATGLKTGNEPGAPDLLWAEAPPLTLETPVYDYATDVEPKASPDTDKGLQLEAGADCGAMPATTIATDPESDAVMFHKLHKWVTPPVPATVTNLGLTGDGTLSLWTQSIEGGVYFARVCVWLFVREAGLDTALVQPLEASPYTTYSEATWPASGWTEVRIPLDLLNPAGGALIPLPPGARLGLALSVDDDTGAGEETGIQTLYDEPSFDSRLSLETTGTLPEWEAP
ncbi:MAG TPA: hypothetical protein VFY04_03255 [Solirubrobacterales bacterium]|nr:hypothetical protein [Solirubrobacterales bacterium]